jgi:lipopolysaccharide transport system ATP-binding protein
MSAIISVENLSKQYRIGMSKRHNSFRDVFDDRVRSLFKAKDRTGAQASNTIWALRDVSFDVQEGEVLGIIGKNGAGKSTLLKILSRITDPTLGCIRIRGRIASLLEVGTGFSGELTGRENIYLNGAILGMKKTEIKNKFDEIVSFAEIEKFIDTPVKHYSSGMYMRLAFAVAAHLEPEILIVDEVLAVGDAAFQKKCLGKMEHVSLHEGRTVLFVSHQMGTIAQLCKRALLLQHGKIDAIGAVSDVVAAYMNQAAGTSVGFEAQPSAAKDIAIIKAEALDEHGTPVTVFTHTQRITIEITCRINKWVRGAEIRIGVRDSRRNVFTTDTELSIGSLQNARVLIAKAVIPGNLLRPEHYFMTLAAYIPNQLIIDLVQDAFSITVIDGGSKYAASEGLDYGCVFVDCDWSIEAANTSE